MWTARRAERNKRRELRLTGDVAERLAGTTLEVLSEETTLGVRGLRHAQVGCRRPRQYRDAKHNQRRWHHQESEPCIGYQALAIEVYLTPGSDDYGKAR